MFQEPVLIFSYYSNQWDYAIIILILEMRKHL